jgi:hypothetical protein
MAQHSRVSQLSIFLLLVQESEDRAAPDLHPFKGVEGYDTESGTPADTSIRENQEEETGNESKSRRYIKPT